MLAYRVLRSIEQGYPVFVFGVYLLALVLALALMFIFPPATILLLWMGLVGLAFVVVLAKLLAVVLHLLARLTLKGGACPRCGDRIDAAREEAGLRRCASCATVFGQEGNEVLGEASVDSNGGA